MSSVPQTMAVGGAAVNEDQARFTRLTPLEIVDCRPGDVDCAPGGFDRHGIGVPPGNVVVKGRVSHGASEMMGGRWNHDGLCPP